MSIVKCTEASKPSYLLPARQLTVEHHEPRQHVNAKRSNETFPNCLCKGTNQTDACDLMASFSLDGISGWQRQGPPGSLGEGESTIGTKDDHVWIRLAFLELPALARPQILHTSTF